MSLKTISRTCAAIAAALSLSHNHSSLYAQGWVENANGGSIVRERSNVSVHITDQVASVEVEEWFRNRGTALGEGDYMFPLPAGAVFASYSLFQGDKEMRGEVLDATQARRVYEEIVRRRKDPALIELVGHGLIRARVFPIAAGETRRVVMRYTQPVARSGDALEFSYPARSIHGGSGVAITVDVANASAFRDAVSATHALTVKRERGAMVVRPSSDVVSDFAITLPLAQRSVGIAMSTHAEGDEDGYFMLRLTPGQVSEEMRVPRDVTVVLDVSGSMSGDKISQAKAALRQLLGSLGSDDRFRMIKFNGNSTEWRNEWTRVTRDDIAQANEWVDNLRADGGTNIGEALADAFRLPPAAGRLPVVLFLTDGLPSVGEVNPERIASIAEKNANGARVFAFGVGHDVNTYLLDRLGAAGRGGAQYVQPGENVESALGALTARIRFPVLTDLALNASGVSLREIYPGTLPDLFGSEDLVILGRYRMESRGGGPRVASNAGSARNTAGTVTITGQRSGKTERYSSRVKFSAGDDGNDFIPRLWASRKLGELTRRVHLQGSSSELMEEIKSTALRYGLLSEYTSYFVSEGDGVKVLGDRTPMVPRDRVASRAVVSGSVIDKNPAAPMAATGSAAVASAEAARQQREVATMADIEAQQKAALARASLDMPTNGVAQVDVTTGGITARFGGAKSDQRVVAGRSFMLRDSVWVDAVAKPSNRVVEVVAFSDRYFALLSALPELRAYASMGDVSIGGANVTIRLRTSAPVRTGAVPTARMSDAETAALVKDFRGAPGKS